MEKNNNNAGCGPDVNLLCKFFLETERQGPGSSQATARALSFIDGLTEQSQLVDLGCGTGGQTMVLAQRTQGQITGLDLFPAFIERFNRQVSALGLQKRVKGIVGSMDVLPFAKVSLDLIWSEGAIYNIGFKRGLEYWRDFLRPDGHVAVTECSWLTEERPAEIHDYWMENYPEMETVPHNIARMQEAGYVPVATFVLPENCWTEHYFHPLHRMREQFLKEHADDKAVEELLCSLQQEEELYEKYKAFYGYVFYIGKLASKQPLNKQEE